MGLVTAFCAPKVWTTRYSGLNARHRFFMSNPRYGVEAIMNKQRVHRRPGLTLLSSVLIATMPVLSPADELAGPETEKLMELSLEELLQVKVTTLSRKPQPLSTTVTAQVLASTLATSIPGTIRKISGIERAPDL